MKRLVQWGAGNIGRSFIGQVFARSGYEVVFIDVDASLIKALNSTHGYEVVVVSQEGEQRLSISGVSAVHASDRAGIFEAVAGADLLSLSVGKPALPAVAAQLAPALEHRMGLKPDQPLDILIAENLQDGARVLEGSLAANLPSWPRWRHRIGLVETSIGKMVPLQTSGNPLVLLAEPYNTLIVDRDAFAGPLPECPFLQPVSPIRAYVDRKLYIHNLGHAAAAYLGFQQHPRTQSLAEVLDDDAVRDATQAAMDQSASVLLRRYPGVFTVPALQEHIQDLIHRFRNRALGDTVFRVGRDLGRKLRFDDRLMGAIIQAEPLGLPWDAIARAYRAGLTFAACDPAGQPYPPDALLVGELQDLTPEERILRVSGLREAGISPEMERRILAELEPAPE
jgi:mannitol-1-phosphate 5-dehydrogenase